MSWLTTPTAPARSVETYVAQVDAVEQHPAARRVVQPRDQAGQRGLAAAGLADEGEGGAGRHVQVDFVQDVR